MFFKEQKSENSSKFKKQSLKSSCKSLSSPTSSMYRAIDRILNIISSINPFPTKKNVQIATIPAAFVLVWMKSLECFGMFTHSEFFRMFTGSDLVKMGNQT